MFYEWSSTRVAKSFVQCPDLTTMCWFYQKPYSHHSIVNKKINYSLNIYALLRVTAYHSICGLLLVAIIPRFVVSFESWECLIVRKGFVNVVFRIIFESSYAVLAFIGSHAKWINSWLLWVLLVLAEGNEIYQNKAGY